MNLRRIPKFWSHKGPFLIAAAFALCLLPAPASAQFFGGTFLARGTTLPATCRLGDLYYKTSAPIGLYSCITADTWGPNGTGLGLSVKVACSETQRGRFWVTPGNAGIADAVEVCAKLADDTYAWRDLLSASGSGEANLSWATLTAGQWTALTATQWLTLN